MSDKWKLGIAGIILIILGFAGIIIMVKPDIDFRVILELMGILSFLGLIAVGAKLATMALEE